MGGVVGLMLVLGQPVESEGMGVSGSHSALAVDHASLVDNRSGYHTVGRMFVLTVLLAGWGVVVDVGSIVVGAGALLLR